MADELHSLIAQANQTALTGERLGLTFARELAKVWRDAEKELRRLIERASGSSTDAIRATRAMVLKEQIRAALERSGYDRLIAASTQASAERMVEAVLSRATVAEIVAFTADVGDTIEALRQIASIDLFSQGDEVATALWRSLSQQLFTTRPVSEIIADLADALDREAKGVQTLYDTQVSVFGRQVESLKTKDLGPEQPFLYVGPIDDVTRPFCLEHAGKVWTREKIDAMDNEQLPNVFLTAGGYNCRHSWIAVESKELRALTNTGERVPEIQADIARAQARREMRKSRRAA